jgi:branched-chain amino acid transport system substrate-binding protein
MNSLRLLSLSLITVLATPLSTIAQVTDQFITIGQSAALTGPNMALGKQMRDGALAYFNSVNETGGIYNRKIELKTVDDGYEPDRTAQNTRGFMSQGIFALFGYVGTPTSIAAIAAMEKSVIPFVFPFTGAERLRTPLNRAVFHIRASYVDEAEKIVRCLDTQGKTKIAIFYQNDSFGNSGLEAVTNALQNHNLKLYASAKVERNSIDVSAAVASLAEAKPQVVILFTTYSAAAEFIRKTRALDKLHAPDFWTTSFVGGRALIRDLGDESRGVMVSQVMPLPTDASIPVVKEYLRLYVKEAKQEPDYASLEGFIAANVFVDALKRCGPKPTRTGLIRALEAMENYSVGGFPIDYSQTKHSGSRFVELTIVTKNGQFMR